MTSEIRLFIVGMSQGWASSAAVWSLRGAKTGWGFLVTREAPTQISYLEKLDKGSVNKDV